MKALVIPQIEILENETDFSIKKKLEKIGAKFFIDCVNWPQQYPDSRETQVFAAHDTQKIYLLFCCSGSHLKAEVGDDLGPVANDSCVEFFVSPLPENKRYWNFEFNAIGRKNVSTRILRPEPRRLSIEELGSIRTIPSAGIYPFSEKEGMQHWSLLVAIPLALFEIEYRGIPLKMKGNFYKCGAKTSSPHYLSWAPISAEKPDFHRPEFFAPITLL